MEKRNIGQNERRTTGTSENEGGRRSSSRVRRPPKNETKTGWENRELKHDFHFNYMGLKNNISAEKRREKIIRTSWATGLRERKKKAGGGGHRRQR